MRSRRYPGPSTPRTLASAERSQTTTAGRLSAVGSPQLTGRSRRYQLSGQAASPVTEAALPPGDSDAAAAMSSTTRCTSGHDWTKCSDSTRCRAGVISSSTKAAVSATAADAARPTPARVRLHARPLTPKVRASWAPASGTNAHTWWTPSQGTFSPR